MTSTAASEPDALSAHTWDARDVGSSALRESYRRQGFVRLKGFFDFSKEILPVHAVINTLIGVKLDELGLDPLDFPDTATIHDRDFMQIVRRDRTKAGQIYRACRHLLPIHQLCTSAKLVNLANVDINGAPGFQNVLITKKTARSHTNG